MAALSWSYVVDVQVGVLAAEGHYTIAFAGNLFLDARLIFLFTYLGLGWMPGYIYG